jgi:integrase
VNLDELYLLHYRPTRLLGRSPATRADMASFVVSFAATYAGPLAGITEAVVARHFARLLSLGRSAATCNKHRAYILALLRFARRKRLASYDWLEEVDRLPILRRIPRAWTVAEIERILAESRREPGNIGGVPAAWWIPALVLTLYDTGLRITAALGIQTADVSLADRCLLARAETQKQRADQWFRLSDQTTAAISPLVLAQRPLLFASHLCLHTFRKHFHRILWRSGVPFGGTSGVFHRLRKSCASYAAAGGVDATQQLGHSSPNVTRAYLDPRICQQRQASDVLPRPAF